jgi:signal transduction histidine kinase
MIPPASRERMGLGAQPTPTHILRWMERPSPGAIRRRLVLVVVALAASGGAIAQLPAALALTRHDPYGPVLNAVVWPAVGVLWIILVVRHARTLVGLWRLPSALFRASLAGGGAAIVVGRVAALVGQSAAPAVVVSSLEDALYELGVLALASLAAFASTRSLLRPLLVETRPPLGARDIALRTRVLVATTGGSFATAAILLNVLIDFDATPPATLVAFLATAAALVACSGLIGWLVGEDASRSIEAVTHRMHDLAHADRGTRIEVPITADEVGDLTVAANELERRIRRDEADAASTAERERIARELHDGVAKSVSVLSLDIASLTARAPGDLRQSLARIEHLAQVLAEELRAIVHEFRTRGDREPFIDALHRAVEGNGATSLSIQGELERVGTLARFEVVRVLEEAVRNAVRHAAATKMTAGVRVDDQALHLVVEDDGKGIAPISWRDLASQGHFGLLGMRERAQLLDGELTITASPGGGTRLALDVPLAERGR